MIGGVPVVSLGNKRSRYPDVRFSVRFLTNGAVPQTLEAVAEADASGVGRATSDVIQCSTHKEIGNPVGTWSITLVPRRDYLTMIQPGDWCQISADNGDGLGMRPVTYGPVKAADLQRNVSDRGVTRTMVQMSGADFGETLVKTSAIYDAQLASEGVISSLGYAALATSGNLPPGTPGGIVRSLVDHYLGRSLHQLIDPATGQPFANTLNLDYVDDAGTMGAAIPTGINPATSLWQLLQQWANLGVNELFVDFRPPLHAPDNVTTLNPCVVLRQCPFYGSAWNNLTTIALDSDEVIDLSMGTSDNDVRNWIRPLDETNTKVYLTENIGTINPQSIKRFGFRRYENSTQYVFPNASATARFPQASDIASILKATAALQTLWHHSNEKLLNASLTLCFRPEIRVGYKINYTDSDTATQYEFYVEAVSHNFSYPGSTTTTLTLTRGRDITDPLWRYPLSTLIEQGIIEQLGNTVTATLAAAVRGIT